MSDRSDLTRWNRSGLSRIGYVDGSAPLFLESIRAVLAERFAGRWPRLPLSPTLDLEAEPDLELRQHRRNQRLIDQYRAEERGDLAWEIARAFSRTAHVLAAHVEAHANEAFLRTATQWESVRRLVELIDYRPTGATSASTELVIVAKSGRSGVLPAGFQVKYTPPEGGEQVIFETLAPLEVSDELNELRPTDWNRSPAPAGPGERRGYSSLAYEAVRVIEGAGPSRSATLDRLAGLPLGRFRVMDLLGTLPALASARIPQVFLDELRAKARVIVEFELPAGFEAIVDWTLAAVTSSDPARLREVTGQSRERVADLLERFQLLRAVLDEPVYRSRLVRALLPSEDGERTEEQIRTAFCVPSKPKLREGDVAMVLDHEHERAAGARIARLETPAPGSPDCPKVHLTPSPAQTTWPSWPKSDVTLLVAPRFHRKAWLNGVNVVRTERPHGMRAGAFVAFRASGKLRFAKVVEADDRNLRLQLDGALPPPGTELLVARPFAGDKAPKGLEFGLVGAAMPADPFDVKKVPLPASERTGAEFFEVKEPPAPPAGSPPFPGPAGLKFGSFLFPSPFLPIDLVKAAVELLLSLGLMQIPSTGEFVFKLPTNPAALVDDLLGLIAKADIGTAAWDALGPAGQKAKLEAMVTRPGAEESVLFLEFKEALKQALEVHGPLLGVAADAAVQAVVIEASSRYVCEGTADKLTDGDWLVADFSDGLRALRLAAVAELGGGASSPSFAVRFAGLFGNEGELRGVYAGFRAEVRAEHGTLNELPLESDVIPLPGLSGPSGPSGPPLEALRRGRKLLLTSASGASAPLVVTVVERRADGLVVTPPVTGFTLGDLIVRGNVVTAGHGAAKPAKRLSSGTQPTPMKAVVLEVEDVSTVDDGTFPKGVRSDVEVTIEGMRWTQVPSLRASKPSEPHYVVEATEEGFARLVFGDGARGRRVPLGTNNVHVGYRVGAGRRGNLPPGHLVKPVNPHWLVERVEQPRPSTRGEELESVDHVRDNAPATLLALERAVSLADFENLTAERNDIWQAKAFLGPERNRYLDRVRVVVVPAGGGYLDASGRRKLEEFLAEHAVPTVAIEVESYESRPVAIDVVVRVDEARYDLQRVVDRVRDELVAKLSLERRKIQETLFLSSVYYLVDGVPGVEDSRCAFRGTSASRIEAENERQVVHLGPEPALLTVTGVRYTP